MHSHLPGHHGHHWTLNDAHVYVAYLQLVEELLGGPIKRPCRNRGIYSIFPRDMSREEQRQVSTSTFDARADTNGADVPPPEAQLSPHLDMQVSNFRAIEQLWSLGCFYGNSCFNINFVHRQTATANHDT